MSSTIEKKGSVEWSTNPLIPQPQPIIADIQDSEDLAPLYFAIEVFSSTSTKVASHGGVTLTIKNETTGAKYTANFMGQLTDGVVKFLIDPVAPEGGIGRGLEETLMVNENDTLSGNLKQGDTYSFEARMVGRFTVDAGFVAVGLGSNVKVLAVVAPNSAGTVTWKSNSFVA